MKIGIMGGTFDPIHIGHLLLGEFAFEEFKLDEIWFLPNGNPPHKDTEEMDTSLTHRIEMVKAANQRFPHFKLSMHEAKKGISYTYRTMRDFHELYPGNEFYVLFWGRIFCVFY